MDQKQIDEALRRAKEAKERAEKVPEGPYDYVVEDGEIEVYLTTTAGSEPTVAQVVAPFATEPIADLFAHSWQDITDLASDIESLAQALREAREEIDRLKRLLPGSSPGPREP